MWIRLLLHCSTIFRFNSSSRHLRYKYPYNALNLVYIRLTTTNVPAICVATTLRLVNDHVSVQVADNLRKIAQLVSAIAGCLTIKISRGKVAEHVTAIDGLGRSHDGRTTTRRRSCMIVGIELLSSRKTGRATSHATECDQFSLVAAGRAISRGRTRLIVR